MYLEYYGLREQPFNITPDPKFLYLAPKHQEALDHLCYGVSQRKGFIELIGEVGCGKTTLCRALLARLPSTVQTALILNPALTGTQLLRAILMDLGEAPCGRDRLSLVDQLNRYLLNRAQENLNVAVIIDEAQNLLPEVMEQIRLLSNLETDQHKLMQIIISGQPELKSRLASPDLRQLRQRITVRCELRPLTEQETGEYIAYRLRVAGADGRPSFDTEAVKQVHKLARGIPRLINALCDQALLAGYVAQKDVVGRKEIKCALDEMGDWA